MYSVSLALIISLPQHTVHDPLEAVALMYLFALVVQHVYLKIELISAISRFFKL